MRNQPADCESPSQHKEFIVTHSSETSINNFEVNLDIAEPPKKNML